VREAFIKLAENGLIQIRPQRGSYVNKISLSQVRKHWLSLISVAARRTTAHSIAWRTKQPLRTCESEILQLREQNFTLTGAQRLFRTPGN
jgi:DNA-binding GntR family transcriptional regulator